jgi:WD40 repeat protein
VLSPDGKHLALFAGSTVTVYDIADAGKRPKLLWRTEGIEHGNAGPRVHQCGFSPDGRTLMVCSSNASVIVDLATQKRGEKIVALYRLPLFTADGRTLVGRAQKSGSLVVANADGSTRAVIDVPVPEINYLYLAERGNKAALLNKHGQLYVVPFDAPAASAVATKAGTSLRVPDGVEFYYTQDRHYGLLEFSPDGKYLVAAPSRLGCGWR